MATSLSKAVVQVIIDFDYQNVLSGRNSSDAKRLEYRKAFSDGEAVDGAEVVFHNSYTVSASGSQTLDLTGALVDAFGNTIVFKKLKAIQVRNMSSTAGAKVTLGTPASEYHDEMFTGSGSESINVRPGGLFLWVDPSEDATAMVADTDDKLTIANGTGAGITVEVTLIGTK